MCPVWLWVARCVWASHLHTEAEGRPETVVRRQRDQRREKTQAPQQPGNLVHETRTDVCAVHQSVKGEDGEVP
ncbi:Wd Repeat-Containing Protein 53 [Manis pentadactyla]|nr:Wd Repeat-Containing Protein 53 [Manis pentadactyla]